MYILVQGTSIFLSAFHVTCFNSKNPPYPLLHCCFSSHFVLHLVSYFGCIARSFIALAYLIARHCYSLQANILSHPLPLWICLTTHSSSSRPLDCHCSALLHLSHRIDHNCLFPLLNRGDLSPYGNSSKE